MLNILEINDFSAPELDIYARRTEAQLINKDNPEVGLFIAESPKGNWQSVRCGLYSGIRSGRKASDGRK